MEAIDDEAEAAGIPIVKVEDRQLAKSVGVFAHPSLVIFRNYGEEAVIYSGDIKVMLSPGLNELPLMLTDGITMKLKPCRAKRRRSSGCWSRRTRRTRPSGIRRETSYGGPSSGRNPSPCLSVRVSERPCGVP